MYLIYLVNLGFNQIHQYCLGFSRCAIIRTGRVKARSGRIFLRDSIRDESLVQ